MNKLTKENLKKYVKCVKDLETSLYSQKQALEKMQNDATWCKKNSTAIKNKLYVPNLVDAEKEKRTAIAENAGSGALIGFLVSLVVAFFYLLTTEGLAIIFFVFYIPQIIGAIVVSILICVPFGAIIGCCVGAIQGEEIETRIRNRNNEETRRIDAQNKRIEGINEKNRQIALTAQSRGIVVNVEKEILEESIKSTSVQLEQYYALNVIYPKYRGLVYMCSIYEYLESGICEGLTGPYGAYSLLENDIKFARVVEKMDNIISNLEQIKENQNELYYAIRETNNQLAELGDTIGKVAKGIEKGNANLEDLKETMSNIEYNSKISADSESFTAAYHFFKN